jgi:hypothetical protein
MNENKMINWIPVIELAVLAFTTLGTTITLYLHTESKMERHYDKGNEILEAIRQDMRDFHGRLCAIEERNKK